MLDFVFIINILRRKCFWKSDVDDFSYNLAPFRICSTHCNAEIHHKTHSLVELLSFRYVESIRAVWAYAISGRDIWHKYVLMSIFALYECSSTKSTFFSNFNSLFHWNVIELWRQFRLQWRQRDVFRENEASENPDLMLHYVL